MEDSRNFPAERMNADDSYPSLWCNIRMLQEYNHVWDLNNQLCCVVVFEIVFQQIYF